MAIQIKTIRIFEGTIQSVETSDPLTVKLADALEIVRGNARLSYFEAFDTPDGAVSMDKAGNLMILSVRIIPDTE